MVFNYELGFQHIDKEKEKVNYREAVRAVTLKGNKILMVHTNKGDYKFPGGGVDKGENHVEALEREVREETGYIVNTVKDKLGTIIESHPDEFEENSFFQMTSHYYLCEISDKKTAQELDDYESELNFAPVWISIDDAIELNEEILKKDKKDRMTWVERETMVLKQLKQQRND